jgi:site-specific DNA-methyltransferase (adenine-specific)
MEYKLFNNDFRNVLNEIPDGSIDLILTDPPYNASNSNIACFDRHYSTVNEEWDKNFTVDFIPLVWPKLKPNGSFLSFCSHHLLGDYLKSGYKVQQIIHWIKTNPFPAIAKVYTPNVEYIVWFVKGSPYCFNKKYSNHNIIKTGLCQGLEREDHPTQKPIKLMDKLLLVHSNENDTIFDLFMGTGTTGVSCMKHNRNFIGIEKEQKYFEIAERRISNEKNQLKINFDFE